MTQTHIAPKLENIISGHSINDDDAAWLRALAVGATRYQAIRTAGTISDNDAPFWDFSISDLSGQRGITPDRLDAEADRLAALIDAANR